MLIQVKKGESDISQNVTDESTIIWRLFDDIDIYRWIHKGQSINWISFKIIEYNTIISAGLYRYYNYRLYVPYKPL